MVVVISVVMLEVMIRNKLSLCIIGGGIALQYPTV